MAHDLDTEDIPRKELQCIFIITFGDGWKHEPQEVIYVHTKRYISLISILLHTPDTRWGFRYRSISETLSTSFIYPVPQKCSLHYDNQLDTVIL